MSQWAACGTETTGWTALFSTMEINLVQCTADCCIKDEESSDLKDTSQNAAASDAALQVINFTARLIDVKRPNYCSTHQSGHDTQRGSNAATTYEMPHCSA